MPRLLAMVTVGLLALLLTAAAPHALAPGAVVGLAGTPHLWIADNQGVLHWGGDTRALAGKHVNWGDRRTVALAALQAFPIGDPWLSAGLLKDGDSIYLVEWEAEWLQPRLLHIQSIKDVELFGINGSNYGNFVLDKPSWEARYGFAVASLPRGVLAAAAPPGVGAGKLYWTDGGTDKIQRANLDGSGVEDLVPRASGLGWPWGLALDVEAGKLYWTDRGRGKIQRANLDGSGVEDLVASGLARPNGLALDVEAGKLYWTDRGTDKIQRANLDGSGAEDLVTSGLSDPAGLALDVGAGKLYWTDGGAHKIQRANLDGSEVEDLVTAGLDSPRGLAVDVGAGKLYWADGWMRKIQRANLDGSGVEDLVTGLGHPNGLALDVGAGKRS